MSRCPTCGEDFGVGQFCPKDGTRLEPDPAGNGEAATEAEADALIGQVIADRFRLVSRLGSGGMGTVYVAQHQFLDKRVALKLLRPEVTTDPDAMARFQREAMVTSTIGHKNIVNIDDCGRLPDGQIYLTMELLEGESLSQLMARRQLTRSELLHVAIQTCHGLGAAHAKGIIHRDLKPDNILLTGDSLMVKILDFGIAKMVGSDNKTNLTKTGTVFGTPNYMSPEQALGKKVDHRADIYSMGVILYEMLTGRLPFIADSFVAVLTLHVTEEPKPPQEVAPERNISSEAQQLVLKAMAKDPDQRFQSMSELISALLQLRESSGGDYALASHLHLSQLGQPQVIESQQMSQLQSVNAQTATAGELVDLPREQPARRWRGLMISLVAVLVVGGGIFFYLSQQQPQPPLRPTTSKRAKSRLARADAAPVSSSPADAVSADAAASAVEEKVDAGAAKGAAAAKVQIIVETVPSGAAIWRDGKKIGRTPDLIDAEVGQQLRLELRKPGYQSQQLEFEARTQEKKIVRLERRRGRGKKAAHQGHGGHGGVNASDHGKTPASSHDHGSDHGDHDEVIDPY